MPHPPKKIQTIPEGITIALPSFNEEATLADMAARALAALGHATTGGAELLIVNDGSADGTSRIAQELAERDGRVRVHEHARNLGFAAVQRSCYRHATQDWIFLIPADGQIAPETLFDFLPLCAENDLILGVLDGPAEAGLRGLNSAAYHALVRLAFALPDWKFGPCLMVRRSLVNSLNVSASTPVAMTELVVRARAAGARIAAVKVEKKPRTHGKARGGRMLRMSPTIASDLIALYWDVNVLGKK